MSDLSAALLIKALDGLSLRMTAIAQNVSNANTTGYQPIKVRFEDALAQAAREGESAVRAVQPELFRDPVETAGDMRLDLELVASATTSGRYAAIAEMLNRSLQLESIAVRGGR